MQITADLQSLSPRYASVRRRTRQIFDLVAPEGFAQRPIPLRHPIRFYEGHLASFNFGMLLQSGFVEHDPQPELTSLFARGIDPLDEASATRASINHWPERAVVHDYIERVEECMANAFAEGVEPLYLHTAVEHEEMHQETLIYLLHQLPHHLKRRPHEATIKLGSALPSAQWRPLPGGAARMGADADVAAFGWDNEFPRMETHVEPFELGSRKVSNGDFLEFVEDGGYRREEFWSADAWRHLQEQKIAHPPFWKQHDSQWFQRGLFEDLPLPIHWPVYVSQIEAEAYLQWCGCRLPTEAEWHRAFVEVAAPDARHDNFDFVNWNPVPLSSDGSRMDQLAGNGWEWTSTVFAGFPGFAPFPHYAGYSADFFDGRHFVLKGASPVTPGPLVRPSFRNWFQDQYRYAYTSFRCARDA